MFGQKIKIGGFAIRGNTNFNNGRILVNKIIEILGMHKAHKPVYYKYPFNGGGGEGFTYIQPITESYIAFDSWPALGGAYLVICSCKSFNFFKVTKAIRELGYVVDDCHEGRLGLK